MYPYGGPRRPGVGREAPELQSGRVMERNGSDTGEWENPNANRKEYATAPGRYLLKYII